MIIYTFSWANKLPSINCKPDNISHKALAYFYFWQTFRIARLNKSTKKYKSHIRHFADNLLRIYEMICVTLCLSADRRNSLFNVRNTTILIWMNLPFCKGRNNKQPHFGFVCMSVSIQNTINSLESQSFFIYAFPSCLNYSKYCERCFDLVSTIPIYSRSTCFNSFTPFRNAR